MVAQAAAVSRARRSEQALPSAGLKRRRSQSAKQRSTKRKRARATDKSRGGDDKAGSTADEKLAAPEATTEAASSSSSVVRSPRRCPSLPLIVIGHNSDGTEIYDSNIDSEVLDAYFEEEEKYCAKLKSEQELPTLDQKRSRTCLSSGKLLPIRESATETILEAAESVMGMSSYIDGRLLAQSTGFFISWDKKAKVGTILTSANLICLKHPSLHDTLSMREYTDDAQVIVHLSFNMSVDGHLLFYHKYYNIALFEVSLKQSPQLLCLKDRVKFAQKVFVLGRNEKLQLNINCSRVQFMGPGVFEHNHYMYVNCGLTKCDAGGPILNFGGKVLGMADPTLRSAFIPISVILRCMHMQKEFKCIPRVHLGLKFSAMKFLDLSHIEEIRSRFKINSGLIVKEVSEGSVSEEAGIRVGDIIEYWNGEHISTTLDLEIMLLNICENHFKNGNCLGSKVDIMVGVFHTSEERHHTKRLTLDVSDDVEVFREGTYPVSARQGISNLVPSVNLRSGRETVCELGQETQANDESVDT